VQDQPPIFKSVFHICFYLNTVVDTKNFQIQVLVLKHDSIACIHLLRFFCGSSQGFYVDTVSYQLYLIILIYVNQRHRQNAKYETFKIL